MNKVILFLILLVLPCLNGISQAAAHDEQSLYFDMTGFPQWSKDLRRAEIVAFGSFPFMFFITDFSIDTYRWAANGQDVRYAPWPFKPAGAEEKNQGELAATLGIAAGLAVTAALVDYIIEMAKRDRQKTEAANNYREPPAIFRRPLNEVIETTDEIYESPGDVP